jgi:hypothetical protein
MKQPASGIEQIDGAFSAWQPAWSAQEPDLFALPALPPFTALAFEQPEKATVNDRSAIKATPRIILWFFVIVKIPFY